MLRVLMIAGGFLTITAGLLYFQPRLGPAEGDFSASVRQNESTPTATTPVPQVLPFSPPLWNPKGCRRRGGKKRGGIKRNE